jgi:hypothetical protein
VARTAEFWQRFTIEPSFSSLVVHLKRLDAGGFILADSV